MVRETCHVWVWEPDCTPHEIGRDTLWCAVLILPVSHHSGNRALLRNYLPDCLPPCADWKIGLSGRLRRCGNSDRLETYEL
jgi:hypothetical protein